MTTKNNELELNNPTPERSILSLLGGMVDRGVTSENVAAFSQLCDLKFKMEDRDAKKEFSAAFAELQSETGKIPATRGVPDNEGRIRYHFAPYEDLMDVVQPLLSRHGFSMGFNTRDGDGKVTAICRLRHKGGHSEDNEFTVRLSPPPKTSAAQADGATFSYAKRFALIQCLNLVTKGMDTEDDARNEGDGETINFKQAAELKQWAETVDADIPAMLAWAKADSFESIPASKYDALCALLKKKEQGK